jgi:hypothetical protein
MNVSVKTPALDRRLERFFRTELLKVAERYRREGRELLAGNPDAQLPTYYVRRSRTRMSKQDFEQGACRDADELATALRDLWQEQGFVELSELAPQLAKLADRLKQSQCETDEISPFVYAMY